MYSNFLLKSFLILDSVANKHRVRELNKSPGVLNNFYMLTSGIWIRYKKRNIYKNVF